jgi:hypothetical protein
MKKVFPLRKELFAEAGLEFTFITGEEVLIILPGGQDMVRAKVADDQVELYPARSSLQKEVARLLAAL